MEPVNYKQIDEAMSKWAQEMRQSNVIITATMAQEKAQEIARALGQDFTPSADWLFKWKERENPQFGRRPMASEQMETSYGNDDILKGLLVRTDMQQENSQMPTNKSDSELQNPIDLPRYNTEGHGHYSMDYSSRDLSKCEMQQSTTFPDASPPSSAKKVPYSYEPVYVLTRTGRYRKEKTFLTLLQKLEILQRIKNGEKRNDLINEYRLSQSAMSQIVADEKKILKLAAIGQNLQMKRIRGGIFKGGEAELNTWVLKKIDDGETLTRSQIKNKAREIAERLNIDFKASTGWLEKWKVRMNMDFNENHVLQRKVPLYIPNQEEEEPYMTNEAHIPETCYGTDDDEQMDDEYDQSKQDSNLSYDQNDHSLDIKPLISGQGHMLDATEVEPEDIKPIINSTLHHKTVPERQPQSSTPPPAAPTQTLHQKVLNWLSKHNIGPTASIELLTILHPIITEACNSGK
ncbi:uncharacterized protein LOC101901356 [Musca domestica]|uniref:Uncharacterized protein LOC101901356 n=1 Tax=Musca domestica TaxID=7370 RepID=A0A1I8N9Z9_MUSDO|nr:uncharacterized protein LOC101901356 [Musca domestica]XP_011291237.1 uncharacterized protein LOC101901356 [Musca domestica]